MVPVARTYEEINDHLRAWIARQSMFFVATAPLAAGGHVNVSPKGPIGSLRVLGPRRIAYLDASGSGAETIAHVRENGRIVIMLCSFEGPPRIVRLHGRGTVTQLGNRAFDRLYEQLGFDTVESAGDGARSIVRVEVERIADSCGYGVPLMSYEGRRTQQADWLDRQLRKSPNAVMDYSREKNSASIDGLPGIEPELLPDRAATTP